MPCLLKKSAGKSMLAGGLSVPYLDMPLGFFMTTQGALVPLLLILLLFARRQDRIDRDHFSDGR
jgi:putative solute:sodium symporter small subunit